MSQENIELKKRLKTAATSGALSHAVILCGDGDKKDLATYLAAAYECHSHERPCLTCEQCRKVLAGIHPDVIWISDDKHKQIPAEDIREWRKDVFIRPNEGERKVYVLEDSLQLSPQGQNFLLKTIEEGPAYAAFVFCTENNTALLPTIRSRCVEYLLAPTQEQEDKESPLAEDFVSLLNEGKPMEAVAYLLGLEKKKLTREDMILFFETVESRLVKQMLSQSTGKLGKKQAMHLAEQCREWKQLCDRNIGVGHLLGEVAVTLDRLSRF